MKDPSTLYKKAVSILKELEEKEGAADRAYAEVITKKREQFWTKAGLKQSTGHDCISRLMGVQCNQHGVFLGTYDWTKDDKPCQLPQANDHLSMWLKDGKPFLYISQPYHINFEAISELVEFCNKFNLHADIDAGRSWWFPGSTLSIEVRSNEL